MKKAWSIFLVTFILFGVIGLGMGQIEANAKTKEPDETFTIFGIKINYTKGDEDDYSDTVKFDGEDIINVNGVDEDGRLYQGHQAWMVIFQKYQKLLVGIWGLALITAIGVFIKLFLKLGVSAANPNERAKAIQGIVFAGIGTALLGSVGILFNIFYSALM